jgi:hypothetical protein
MILPSSSQVLPLSCKHVTSLHPRVDVDVDGGNGAPMNPDDAVLVIISADDDDEPWKPHSRIG